MIKKTFIDLLFGVLVIILVTICEFLVTLPFGDPNLQDQAEMAKFINLELLLTALPALGVTWLLAWLLKTATLADALRRSIIWTAMLALSFLAIGIGNSTLQPIYGNIGIYVLLAGCLAGPLMPRIIRRRTKS